VLRKSCRLRYGDLGLDFMVPEEFLAQCVGVFDTLEPPRVARPPLYWPNGAENKRTRS
jgi:hypothetical protein